MALPEDTKLEDYSGKKVTLVYTPKDAETAVEVEGKVDMGSAIGIIFKAKGKAGVIMVEPSQIEEIRLLVTTSDTGLTARKLDLIKPGSARSHLLERHGYTLGSINAMTEEAAAEFHKTLDHVATDLGHVHVDKAAEKEALAAKRAAAEQAGPAGQQAEQTGEAVTEDSSAA